MLLQKLLILYSQPCNPAYNLVVHGLATWRVTHILVYEAGPYNMFIRLRESMGIAHDEGGTPVAWPDGLVLTCALCTSVWVATIMLLVPTHVKTIFAASAVACILEQHNG